MTELYRTKYRIQSARANWWDYRKEGIYFITICTKNRAHFFGKISDGKMKLSAIGKLVEKEWLITPSIRADMNIVLEEFVVMPNHFHAIIVIGKNQYNSDYIENEQGNKFGSQSKNLAAIIRGFKSAVTSKARLMDCNFMWQTRFHDTIIRDEQMHENISTYILNNAYNWKADQFYK